MHSFPVPPVPAVLLKAGIGLFARMPALPRRITVEALVNHALRVPLREQAFDWLAGRWLGIRVEDTGLALRFTLEGGALRCMIGAHETDVLVSAGPRTLLLLAAGREDADTLFFQRRLRISGDTELGVAVKNTLDAYGPGILPAMLQGPLRHVAGRIHT